MSKKKHKRKRLLEGVKIRIGKAGVATVKSKKVKEKIKIEYSPSITIGKITSQGVAMYKLNNCIHPLQAKVGKHEIVMISWKDFEYSKHVKLINGLDVYIGLCSGFETYELFKKEYENPLLQSISTKFQKQKRKLKNVIVLEIADGSYSESVFKIVKSMLDEGKLIGFGCHGAHGRTGWLYARLIKHYEKVSGDTAVRRARERYCEKMVETSKQIKQLGCKKMKGSYATGGFVDTQVYPLDAFDEIPIIGTAATSPFSGREGLRNSSPYGDQMRRWEEEFESVGIDSSKSVKVAATVEDEENCDQVVKALTVTPEQIVMTNALYEAYNKEREGKSLTEEEERLIEEDMYRLINEKEV